MNNKARSIKKPMSEIIGGIIIRIIMVAVIIVTLYPFVYVLSMSISSQEAVLRQDVWLYPVGWDISAYKKIMETSQLWQSYGNTIYYTVLGTAINLLMTVFGAFPLSRKTLAGRKVIMLLITIPMFIGGGMIPMFMVINWLGIYDSVWAMVLPGAVSSFNLIIARNFFEGIPESLIESARLDGANDIIILFRIIVPLSLSIIAVLALFYAVGHWNTYMNALLFLPSVEKQTLQIYLQKLLVTLSSEALTNMPSGVYRGAQALQLRYAAIIVTTLPIICVYPFLQRYFVQGIMIGAVKE